jgi:hypothetical protein
MTEGHGKPKSIPPRTDEIDTAWEGFDREAPTKPGTAFGKPTSPPAERPTAVPPVPVEEYAQRLMRDVMTDEEEKSALAAPAFPVVDIVDSVREAMPTLVDENAGMYDVESLQARSPVLGRRDDSGSHAIPLELASESGGGALDMVAARVSPVVAEQSKPSADPLVEMRDRYAVGDFSGALAIAETVLAGSCPNAEAQRYAANCRDILTQMYSARLGSTSQVPKIVLPADQIRWLTLDHRSGFLLSCIDGISTIEEILDVSGMVPLDALRILCDLLQQQVIEMRQKR